MSFKFELITKLKRFLYFDSHKMHLLGLRAFLQTQMIEFLTFSNTSASKSSLFYPGGGGVLPYITYTGMCRPTGSWFWSSWFRTGYPFQRRFLERGIIFQTHESFNFVSSHLKLFKDRLLLKIWFNASTSKLLYSYCTLERSIKNWPISRTGYRF